MMRRLVLAACALPLLLAPATAQKVSTMTPASTPLSGGELIYCVQNGQPRKCTAGELSASVLPAQLTNGNTAAYSPTNNYVGGTSAAGYWAVLGSQGSPDLTHNAVAILQKWAGSTATSGVNPTLYVSTRKETSANLVQATSIFTEAQDDVGCVANACFVEGIRSHGLLNTGATNGSAYGVVGVGGEQSGVTYVVLAGGDLEADNNSGTDAPASFNPLKVAAAVVAESNGSNKDDAAFLVNPFLGPTATNAAAFLRGFYVPKGVGAITTPVTSASFESDAASTYLLRGDLMGQGNGKITLANNTGISANLNDNATLEGLLQTDASNNVFMAVAGWTQVQIGSNSIPAVIQNFWSLPRTAPGNPSSGWFIYVDSGDSNKLKAKASTGTVVTLATP